LVTKMPQWHFSVQSSYQTPLKCLINGSDWPVRLQISWESVWTGRGSGHLPEQIQHELWDSSIPQTLMRVIQVKNKVLRQYYKHPLALDYIDTPDTKHFRRRDHMSTKDTN
jgi:hypothetical protein